MSAGSALPSGAGLITSRQNARVQELAKLRTSGFRRETGLFLIEGLREISRALAAGAAIREVYFQPALFRQAQTAHALLASAARRGAGLCELSPGAFEKVSAREGADGLLATATTPDVSLDALAAGLGAGENNPGAPAPLFLVAEAVEKPGNLGALFRTADSAGGTALLCCDPVADVFNPNAVRASQGALFSVPCAVGTPGEIAAFLARRNVSVFATSPAAETCYWDADFRRPAAILLGSEKDGLSPFWLTPDRRPSNLSVLPISIPQSGLSDSLNVGMAAAICLYEARRQRAL
ncbi:MAG: RNA methyltransferase [Puniceicoccales bacterium]|jgi:TrmH family RNA methyltransferase|nr:RNA methyltransferase [Puniceicoccales bacterium]